MWKARLDNLSRLLGEAGNPLHSPDVSSTRLHGGPDTTLQVSKLKKFGTFAFLTFSQSFGLKRTTVCAYVSGKLDKFLNLEAFT